MKSAVLTTPVELSSSLDGGSAFHLKLNTRRPPPQEGCTLFLRYLFPPELYVDPYELEDQLGHPFWLNDTVNLEVPVGTESTRNWVQLQVAVDDGEDVSVPVHARYGVPLDQNHGRVALPQPFGIWSCVRDDSKPTTGPIFNTTLSPLTTASSPSLYLQTPLGTPSHLNQVELGTAAVVTATFVYLLSVFFTTTQKLYAKTRSSKSS